MRISHNMTRMDRSVRSVAAVIFFTVAAAGYDPDNSVLAEDGIKRSAAEVLSVLRRAGNPSAPQASSVTLFSEANPRTQFYTRGSRIMRVFGKAFGSGVRPDDTADAFRRAHAKMFGVSAANLHPVSILQDGRHTQYQQNVRYVRTNYVSENDVGVATERCCDSHR